MGRLLVQRFSLALIVLALVSLIVFVMVEFAPWRRSHRLPGTQRHAGRAGTCYPWLGSPGP